MFNKQRLKTYKMKKLILFLTLPVVATTSHSESFQNSYCETLAHLAYNAQTYRQKGSPYQETIKKLRKAPEKLSSSKRENDELVFRIVQDAYYDYPEYTVEDMRINAIQKFTESKYLKCINKY